jgi:iron complex outermembrane receptor protein
MKNIIYKTAALLLFIQLSSYGQITGKVTDKSGASVPFVNVAVLKAGDSTFVAGNSTDTSGIFSISIATEGVYLLSMSSIGYRTLYSKPVSLSAAIKTIDSGTFILEESTNDLEAVTITAKKDWIQNTETGQVINVQSSLMTKGSNALQVLEKLPGVITDRRNNQFSLRGQSGVTILFNGRKVAMPVEEVMALLENTVADNIEKIELITSPSARYDADGGAGIINIIFKKNEDEGTRVNFSATAGYGYREKGVTSLSLSQGFRRSFLNASYSFLHDASRSGYEGSGTGTNPNIGGEGYNEFSGYTERVQNVHNAALAGEVRLNARTVLGSELALSFVNNDNLVRIGGSWDIKNAEFVGMKSISDGTNTRRNVISSVYLKDNISPGSQVNVDASYINYFNDSPTLINSHYFDREGNEIIPLNPVFTFGNRGESVSKIQVGVLKADYITHINEKINAEFGVKGSYAYNTNDSRIERKVDDAWETDPRSQSLINSQEKIMAVYTQFKFLLNPKSNLQAGLRYEYWERKINVYKEPFTIAKIFPSVLYTHNFNENNSISFNYNRRISRPAYADLVSNLFYNDPTAVFGGNPLLKPGITDALKAEFTRKGFNAGLSFQYETNPIIRYQLTSNAANDILIMSPQNVDYQKSVNLNVNFPVELTDWWKISLGTTTSLRNYKISYSLSPAVKTYVFQNISFTQSIRLPKSFEVELSGWRNLAFYDGSNKIKGFGILNLGIAKKLKDNKGTIQLALPDLLQSFSIYTHIGAMTPIVFNIRTVSNYRDETAFYRVVKLTYSRSFGNANVKKAKQTDTDEEKERVRN